MAKNQDLSMNKNKYLGKGERMNYFTQKGETQLASTSLNNPFRTSSLIKQSDFFDPHSGIIRTSDTIREEPTYTEQGEPKFNNFIFYSLFKSWFNLKLYE